MSSPGVMHARQFEPIERKSLNALDAQEAHAYPASYEEARRRLLSSLLSMPTAPPKEITTVAIPRDLVTDIPDFELSRDRARAGKSAANKEDVAGGTRQRLEELCYVSSFDRLTSKKCEAQAPMRPASVRIGVHLGNVLTVTAGFVVAAFVYAALGGGLPELSTGVRSFLTDRAAKVRSILDGHDVGNSRAAPVLPLASVKEASADPTPATVVQPLLYSTASIAFTPLK